MRTGLQAELGKAGSSPMGSPWHPGVLTCLANLGAHRSEGEVPDAFPRGALRRGLPTALKLIRWTTLSSRLLPR